MAAPAAPAAAPPPLRWVLPPKGIDTGTLLDASLATLRMSRKRVNVLLLGPKGIGKTAFLHTVLTALQSADKPNIVQTGQRWGPYGVHGTVEVVHTAVPGTNTVVMDWWGTEAKLPKDGDVVSLVNGHMPNGAQISENSFDRNSAGYIADPTDDDRVHVILLLVNGKEIADDKKACWDELKTNYARVSGLKGVPWAVAITHIDEIDAALITPNSTSLRNAYDSQKVQEVAKSVSEFLHLRPGEVMLCKPLHRESSRDGTVDMLALDVYARTVLKGKAFRESLPPPKPAKRVAPVTPPAPKMPRRLCNFCGQTSDAKSAFCETASCHRAWEEAKTPSPSASPAPSAHKRWTCEMCRHSNEHTNKNCGECTLAAPLPPPPPGKLRCGCGHLLEEAKAQFCERCGQKVVRPGAPVKCSACDGHHSASAKFCPLLGVAIGPAKPSAAAPAGSGGSAASAAAPVGSTASAAKGSSEWKGKTQALRDAKIVALKAVGLPPEDLEGRGAGSLKAVLESYGSYDYDRQMCVLYAWGYPSGHGIDDSNERNLAFLQRYNNDLDAVIEDHLFLKITGRSAFV